jgi:acetyltransferase-like isoleucine patch superfamily enzyme
MHDPLPPANARHVDPETARKRLGPDPMIHPTAEVRDSRFGAYCEVMAGTRVAESSFGDYSYVARDSDIIYTTIGKFCSIAAQVRLNPGNHPLDRVALNHFTYRSSAYDMGEDDAGFFDWRRKDDRDAAADTAGSQIA